MARKTTFTYSCDSCGEVMDRQRDLQRFLLALDRVNVSTHADFCLECERNFLATVEPFFPAENLPKLHAMSREEE